MTKKQINTAVQELKLKLRMLFGEDVELRIFREGRTLLTRLNYFLFFSAILQRTLEMAEMDTPNNRAASIYGHS